MTYAASPAPLTFDSVGDAFNRYAPVMDLGWSDWLTITQPMLDALGGGVPRARRRRSPQRQAHWTFEAKVEIKCHDKPALVAELLSAWKPNRPDR